MLRAISRDSTGGDFTPLRGEISEGLWIFIIDFKTAVSAKFAYFSAMEGPSESAPARRSVPVTSLFVGHD